MNTLGFACIAVGVIVFALVSKRLESTVITPPMIFTVFGLVIGETVFGVAKLDFGHGFIHGLAEITLILVLFSDAARIDLRQLRKDHNLPVRMLLVGMPLTIALGILAAASSLPMRSSSSSGASTTFSSVSFTTTSRTSRPCSSAMAFTLGMKDE